MLHEEEADDIGRWPSDLIAYLCVIGSEGETWAYLPLDVPELTWPDFCRQN